MQHLDLRRLGAVENSSTERLAGRPNDGSGSTLQLAPLLLDIRGLAELLSRSVASLHRDDAAGRLPGALRVGSSKRWRYSDIVLWVELGCPTRAEFEARRPKQ
jgi:hypothetical protein